MNNCTATLCIEVSGITFVWLGRDQKMSAIEFLDLPEFNCFEKMDIIRVVEVIEREILKYSISYLDIIIGHTLSRIAVLDILLLKSKKELIQFELIQALDIDSQQWYWSYYSLGKRLGQEQIVCSMMPKLLLNQLLELGDTLGIKIGGIYAQDTCPCSITLLGDIDDKNFIIRSAVGLGYQKSNPLNLVPSSFLIKKEIQSCRFFLWGLGTFVLGFLLLSVYLLYNQNIIYKKDIATLDASIAQLQQYKKQFDYLTPAIASLERSLSSHSGFEKDRMYWIHILGVLQEILQSQQDIWLDTFIPELQPSSEGFHLHISGFIFVHPSLSSSVSKKMDDFLKALSLSGYFMPLHPPVMHFVKPDYFLHFDVSLLLCK